MNMKLCIPLMCTLYSLPAFGQRTIVVDLEGGGDFTEIQPAIHAAQDGNTVLVNPGEYVTTRASLTLPMPYTY